MKQVLIFDWELPYPMKVYGCIGSISVCEVRYSGPHHQLCPSFASTSRASVASCIQAEPTRRHQLSGHYLNQFRAYEQEGVGVDP